MEPSCYIFSAHGWLSKTSQWTSDLDQAKDMGLSEAREIVKRHRSEGNFTAVPVRMGDLPL